MIISHNMMALNAMRQYNIVTDGKKKNTEKLSSGYKINRAADDAAGLAISEKMRRQIRGLRQGSENTQDGISWLQVGDGAMSEINDMIHRIEELSVKAANDTNTDDDRAYIDVEINQLKKQINSIARTTTFNELEIFDNNYVEMNIDGTPSDLSAFNASYDNGKVSWGGIIVNGNRVTWDTIDVNMVTLNDANEQIFIGGDYTYSGYGLKLNIHVEDGDKPPMITRTIDIAKSSGGISIDGKEIKLAEIKDEDGKSLSNSNYHEGLWSFDYFGATVSYFVPEGNADSLEAIVEAIAGGHSSNVTYTWNTEYVGTNITKAVDIDNINSKTQVTNAAIAADKEAISNNNHSYTLKASKENGLWLEDSAGILVSGSEKSWGDIGITSWDKGNSINSKNVYKYTTTVNGEKISFDLYLADCTSVDSVVDGLNGAYFKAKSNTTSYRQIASVNTSGNIESSSYSSSSMNLTLSEEVTLGRNFDIQRSNIEISADATTTSENVANNQMKMDIDNYLSFVENLAVTATLSGRNSFDINDSGLASLVGNGKITDDGYFSKTLTIAGGMQNSNGSGSMKGGVVGNTYPTAFIDFVNVNESNIDGLLGTGFNSTCKTCSNHYSVVFSSGVSSATNSDGVQYKFQKQGASDYMLQIDIDSLKQKIANRSAGMTEGEIIAGSIQKIMDDAFDFHYTQYASEGSKLYIYDNRSQNSGAPAATFDTKPFGSDGKDTFSLSYNGYNGKTTTVTYKYDYSDIADTLKVSMVEASGDKLTDGTKLYKKDSSGAYEECVTDISQEIINGTKLYYLDKHYEDKSGAVTGRADIISSYASTAINEMKGATKINLQAQDYAYLIWDGNENSNVAINPNYSSDLKMSAYDNGIWIWHSSNQGDKTYINRFAMTTASMGLYNAGTKTVEQAKKTIDATKRALNYVAEKRATYGALQNRLEHTYNNNKNKEENMTAAESRIRDTDMAKVMVQQSVLSILEQVGASMLSQANQTPQGVLSLLG